jgi:hypothetical protein
MGLNKKLEYPISSPSLATKRKVKQLKQVDQTTRELSQISDYAFHKNQ